MWVHVCVCVFVYECLRACARACVCEEGWMGRCNPSCQVICYAKHIWHICRAHTPPFPLPLSKYTQYAMSSHSSPSCTNVPILYSIPFHRAVNRRASMSARKHVCSQWPCLTIPSKTTLHILRVGQHRIYTPCTTVYLVISLPKYSIYTVYTYI